MKVLVTGGAGFIGSALVRNLAAQDIEVCVLDDMSRGNVERLAGIRHHRIVADVRDPDAVTWAMQGATWVFHAAYLQGTQTFYANPREVLDVALRGMLNVLDACAKTACSNMVLFSSSEAYQVADIVPTPEETPLTVPDPLNPRYSYGGGKIACELAALAWARDGILDCLNIVRPHNVIGPDMGREHVIPEFAIRMNKLNAQQPSGVIEFPIQGTGQETRCFVYIDDFIAQLNLAWGAENGIYHLGTEDERTIEDVAHAVAACYGRKVKVTPGSLPKGSPPRRIPDTRKIRSLGYDGPVTGFSDAVARTVKWYQENG